MANLGSFSVDVMANIAKFTSDMGKAANSMQTSFGKASAQTNTAISRMTEQAEKNAQRMERTFSGLRSAAIGIFSVTAAAQFTRNLGQTADAYANVTSKLNLATQGTKLLGATQEQVFQISQRTYSSLDSTATLVSRTTRALVSNGADAATALQQSLALTETIQQAFLVSGATAAESANAIIQLSQGLAAGALRGEEYNSVAEQGSRITQALAAHLKVTTGELREMAKEGKLTAEVVTTALMSQASAIAAEAAKIPMTISRAMVTLDNSWTKYIGDADQAAGASRAVAEAIAGIGNNLGPIIDGVTALGAVIAVNLGAKAVSGLTGMARGAIEAAAAERQLALDVQNAAMGLEEKTRIAARNASASQKMAAGTYAEAGAEVRLSTARENVIRSNALKAKSEIELARLSNQLTAAEGKTAVSTRALGAAREKLVAANAAAIISEREYQAALANSAAKTGAAAAASGGFLSTIGKLGSGLMSLAGGPLGVAVLAIGGLYLAMSNATAESEAFEARLKSTEKALDDFNRTALAADLSTLFNVETGGNAAWEDIKRLTDQIKALEDQAQSLESRALGRFAAEFSSQARDARSEAASLQDQLDRLNAKAADAGNTFLAAAREMLGFGRAAQTVAADMGEWFKAAEKQEGQLRSQRIELTQGFKAMLEHNAMEAAGVTSAEALSQAVRDQIDTLVAEKSQIDAANESKRVGVKATKDLEKANNDAEKAAEKAAEAHEKYAVTLAKMQAEGLGPLEKVQADYAAQLLDIDRQLSDGTIPTLEQYYQTLDLVAKANNRATAEAKAQAAALEKQRASPQRLLAAMRQEINLLGMTTRERERAVAVMQAEEAMRSAIQDAQDAAKSLNVAGLGQAQIDDMMKFAKANALAIDSAQELESILSNFENFGMSGLIRDLAKVEEALKRGTDEAGKAFSTEQIELMQRATRLMRADMAVGLVGAFKSVADGLGSMAEEGSSAQKNLQKVSAALAVTQAVLAVIMAAQAPPPVGFATMAAMAAAVGGLLSSIGAAMPAFGGGGGISAQSAEAMQAAQGTGTILGDSEAKSESILNALEITANATEQLVGINRGMLRALQSLESGIGSASGVLARGAGTIDVGPLESQGGLLGLPTLGLANMIFGGKQELIDQGIRIMGGALNDLLTEVTVGAYNTVRTDGGWFSSDDIDTNVTDITDQFGAQFALIIESIATTVREGALALGLLPEQVEAAMAAYQVAEVRISLMDLSAEEQQAELSAVFSSIFDGLAASVVPFIEQFQKLGEGLGETLVRVATSVQVTQEAMLQLGFALDQTDPEMFAQIAVGLIELTGGIDEFISQMSDFVNNFAPEAHKFEVAQDALTRAFAQSGLAIPATRDAMWELMQSLDATTEEGREQIATILRLAGHADAYYSSLEDQAEAAADAAQEAAELAADAAQRQLESMTAYADTVIGINRQLYELSGATAFRQSLADIREQYQTNVRTLREHALAAGLSGARTEDMTAAMQLQARQIVALIRELESSALSQAEGLGLTPLAMLNTEIEALSETERRAADEAQRLGDSLREVGRISSEVAAAMLGDFGPLSGEAKANYALQALQSGAIGLDAALNAGRDVFASGQDFNRFFNAAVAIAQSRPEEAQAGGGDGVSFAMRELLKQQTELQAEAARRTQMIEARELAATIADLSFAREQDFQTVIDSLGIDMQTFLAQLGFTDDTQLGEYIAALQQEQQDTHAWWENNVTADGREIVGALERLLGAESENPMFNPDIPIRPPSDKDRVPEGTTQAAKTQDDMLVVLNAMREELAALRELTRQGVGAEVSQAASLQDIAENGSLMRLEESALRPRGIRSKGVEAA